MAVPGVNKNTPASSAFSNPTKIPGRFCRGRFFNAASKSLGASFPAQPADLAYSVSLIRSFLYQALALFGVCAFFSLFHHSTLAIEGCARIHDQNRSQDIADDAAGGIDLDAAFCFEIPKDPTM